MHYPARSPLLREPVHSRKDRTNSHADVHSRVQHSSSTSEEGILTSRMNYKETINGIYIFHRFPSHQTGRKCYSSLTTQPGWVHICSRCLSKVTDARNSTPDTRPNTDENGLFRVFMIPPPTLINHACDRSG